MNYRLKRLIALILIVFLLVIDTTTSKSMEVKADINIDITMISLNEENSAMVDSDGNLWMWGDNRFGQLLNGTILAQNYPIKIMEEVVSVSLGKASFGSTYGNHYAVIKRDGSLWVWGNNSNGQLGDGTTIKKMNPIKIMEDVAAISLGSSHSAAIKKDGSLWMWGNNLSGQLGDGTTVGKTTPVQVMTDIETVSLGNYYSAAVKKDGSLWMWGSNSNGALGDGTTVNKTSPIQVMSDVLSISLGGNHSGAIKKDGSLWMWGSNTAGQLGDKSISTRYNPVKVMDDVLLVSTGEYHSGAIKKDGSLWMWGSNYYGQLGNDECLEINSIPKKIMENVELLSLGGRHTAIKQESGNVYTCGLNANLQLGYGIYYSYKNTPVEIMKNAKYINSGGDDRRTNSSVIKKDGSMWVWGGNAYHNLGIKENPIITSPTKLLDSVTSVDLNEIHSALLKQDGSLWLMGNGANGEIGDGITDYSNRSIPTKILDNVLSFSLTSGRSGAVKLDGSLWMWGSNTSGAIGNGDSGNDSVYSPIKIMDNVSSIGLTNNNSMALKKDATLWIWGSNRNGEIGDGTTTDRKSPVKVMDDIVSYDLSYNTCGAIKTDGSLWMWGDNTSGKIGDGTTTKRISPTKIMDDVVSISLYATHSAAIKKDGSLWMWGDNTYGQLGDGTTVNKSLPIKIMDEVEYVKLSTNCTAVIKKDGSLWMWGDNTYGQLGNGTLQNSNNPVKILDNVVEVELSGIHSGAIKEDGSLWMWGDNYYRQLGCGEEYYYAIPKIISFGKPSEEILPIPTDDSPIYKIDYKNQQLIVSTNTNTMFFLGTEDKKGIVKTYELFEAGETSTKIPLSSFATTKEWKLKLYGNIDNIPADITLTAGAKKVKAVYAQTETTVSKRIKFTNDGAEVEIDKLEYRTAGSQWLDASTLTIEQLDAHAVYGATLFFRIKAVEDSNPYSKETKMKIPKKANAPKVKIDYAKLTAKFPANTEYRIKHSDTWTASPTAAVNLTSITNISTTHFYLEVRKAALNGKAASKIAITTVDSQQPGPSISTTAGVILLTNEKANGVTTNVKLKNTSEKAIEYAIVAKDTDIHSINTASQKWKKLAKGAEVSLKKKDSDEKIIIARYAAITTKNETPQFASKITKSIAIVWVK